MELLNSDKVTRQELVDYIVNKKVREIEAILGPLKTKKFNLNKEIDGIKVSIEESISELSVKHIKSIYGKMMGLMAKNLEAKPIIIPAFLKFDEKAGKTIGLSNRMLDDIMSMFGVSRDEAVIVFIDEDREDKPRGFRSTKRTSRRGMLSGYPPHMDSPYGMDPSFIRSLIRVDMNEIEGPKTKKLTEKLKLMENEYKALQNLVDDGEKEINQIHKDRNLIKDSIIEQALNSTPEGQALLENLNKLPLGQKLLGS